MGKKKDEIIEEISSEEVKENVPVKDEKKDEIIEKASSEEGTKIH